MLTEQFIERYVAQLKRLWIARVDHYAQYQTIKGILYKNLTDKQLYQHARGDYSATGLIGPLIPLPCGLTGCWWMMYDLDCKDGDPIRAAANEVLAHELYRRSRQGALLENCGGGSYHVWKFLPDANKTIQFNKAENVASYAISLLPEKAVAQVIPSKIFDNYPRKFTGGRLPGKHHTRDDYSQLWDGEKFVDYGTEEWLRVLETLEQGQIEQVPIHRSTFASTQSTTLGVPFKPEHNPYTPPKEHNGVGTQFKNLLEEGGITTGGCGGCTTLLNDMNTWGSAKCREQKEIIMQRLAANRRTSGVNWVTLLRALPSMLKLLAREEAIALTPTQALSKLVDLAIEREEERLKQ